MTYKAIIAGHLCLDITPVFPQTYHPHCGDIFRPGNLTNVHTAVLSTGGAVSNTGIALSKLGIDVFLNAKLSNDSFGSIIKDIIKEKAKLSLKIDDNQSSSYTIVLSPPGVDRIVFHHPGTNDTFVSSDLDYDCASSCDLFHFGYPPLMRRFYLAGGDELVKAFKQMKQLGLTTSLDMALPDPSSESGQANWQMILKNVLPYVDIFLPSIEEIAFMLNRTLFEQRRNEAKGQDAVLCYRHGNYRSISKLLLEMGAKIVMIKSGIRGIYLHTASSDKFENFGRVKPANLDEWTDRQLWASSLKTEHFASTLGAGDSTVAGFLAGLLKGLSPENALKAANIAGWQNVQWYDALSGIKDWPNIKQLLDTDMTQNTPYLDEQEWTYLPNKKVYRGRQDISS
jgi:sugar/nucleoside kinase (ribokinase family)